MARTYLVTGGAGFIGSNFVHFLAEKRPGCGIVVLDKLTYAGNLESLADLMERIVFLKGDIAVPEEAAMAFDAAGDEVCVVHFAAESHVDRSIESAAPFLRTNVEGTQVLLDLARSRGVVRFLHVSTDEVYGSLLEGEFAGEQHLLRPSNPYAASKAASDHLVSAAAHTHGLDVVITRCSNNFGPFQFPEKFVPLMIANALEERPLPIYGDGLQQRDWIHVADHCEALLQVLERGKAGTIYNVAGSCHRTNLEVARFLLAELKRPETLLRHVADRPGHDRRYAPDAAQIRSELG